VNGEEASRWLQASGVTHEPVHLEERELAELRELRDAIYRIGHAAVENRTPPSRDLRALNAAAQRGDVAPQLGGDWSLSTPRDAFESALAMLARDAISLFADAAQRAHLRTCEQGDCAALFLDRSRGERRRWCSMARCGSRAKVAAFRQRHKKDKS
jgi:predicted RNA-binding Zn ribbon-like protein